MQREWNVTDSMGNVHHITYKAGGFGGAKYTIDNDTYKAKSKNWFIFLADYQISLPGAECNLVAVGNKVRLAVNGVYLDDGTPYEPVRNIPVWSNVLVAVAFIFAAISCGVIGAVISVFVCIAILKSSLDRKYGAAIAIFAVFMAVILAIWVLAFMGGGI